MSMTVTGKEPYTLPNFENKSRAEIAHRMVEMHQAKLEELERRIAKLENDQMLTMQTSPEKMPLQFAIAHLEGMAHVAQRRVRELDALEQRIEKLERKLGVEV